MNLRALVAELQQPRLSVSRRQHIAQQLLEHLAGVADEGGTLLDHHRNLLAEIQEEMLSLQGTAWVAAAKECRSLRERIAGLEQVESEDNPPPLDSDRLEWLAYRLGEVRLAIRDAKRDGSHVALERQQARQDELKLEHDAEVERRREEEDQDIGAILASLAASLAELAPGQLAEVREQLPPEALAVLTVGQPWSGDSVAPEAK